MSDDTPGPLSESQLREVLRRVDSPPTDIRYRPRRSGPRYVAVGDDTHVVVDLAGQPDEAVTDRIRSLVVRDDRSRLAVAHRTLNVVGRRADVPTPVALVYEPDPEVVSVPYLVTRRVAGDSYDNDGMNRVDDAVAESIVSEAGRYLARIHEAASFDRSGDLDIVDDGLTPTGAPDWKAHLRSTAEENLDRAAGTRFDDVVEPIRDRIDRTVAAIDGPFEPVLDPDYRLGALTIDPDKGNRVTASLGGWENSRAVTRVYGLIDAEESLINRRFAGEDRRRALRERLYEGYESVRPGLRDGDFERRADLYRLVLRSYAMGVLQYWLDEAPDHVVRSRARRHREFVEGILDDH